MSNFPILCILCSETLKGDNAYLAHMQTVHSATQQAKEKNLPKDIPAVVLDKDAPPSDEFMEIAKMMDKPTPPPNPVQLKPVPPAPVIQQQTKPIILKYKYEGTCEKDNTPIKTIMVEVAGQLVANGYCMNCDEVKKQINVHPIEDTLNQEIKELVKERKEAKNEKRSKPVVRDNSPLQTAVPTS